MKETYPGKSSFRSHGVKKPKFGQKHKKSTNLQKSREEKPVKETYPGKSSFRSHGGQENQNLVKNIKNQQTSKIPEKKNL